MGSRFLVLSLAALLAAPALPALAQGQGEAAQGTPPEWLDADVRVALPSLDQAEVEGSFALHQVLFQGSARTAQDLRDAYRQAGFLGGEDLYVAALETALEARLESALLALFPGADVEVHGAVVDVASLQSPSTSDPRQPPVRMAFTAAVAPDLGALGLELAGAAFDEDALRTALEIGAVARVPYGLTAQPGWNVTYTFEAPAWARLGDAPGARLSADGGEATWDLANWRGLQLLRAPAALTVRARDAPPPLGPSDAAVALHVDMADVDISLPGLLAQDFGDLLVRFDARVAVRTLRIADFPALRDQVEARLPAGITLDGLSADGFRRAVRDGLLPRATLDLLEDHFGALAEERVAGFGAEPLSLEGGFADGSLDPAAISAPLDGDPPLTYTVTAAFRVPLGGAQASRLQAAAGPILLERTLSFDLPAIEGLRTTYRVTLPPGIAFTDVEVEGGRAEQGSDGGRDYVVVTPDGEGARATFTVAVTAGFLLHEFWYVWAMVLFIVAAAVALVVWRRRMGRRPRAVALPPEPAAPLAAPAPQSAP